MQQNDKSSNHHKRYESMPKINVPQMESFNGDSVDKEGSYKSRGGISASSASNNIQRLK